ncbi:MAG: peptidase S8 [Rubrobacter sp.]|jgi:thermitase|nr:peptidase S8 [Rubrobacter sp.]MBA3953650.1 peptidase S8 [Rubrobacter sp.]MDQ3638198.1 S8 family peptidase [Actinomycetota bacterium]
MIGLARQTAILALAALAAVMLLALAPQAWGQAPERAVEGPGTARYVPDELIVTYEPRAPAEPVRAVGRRFEARAEEAVPELDARLLSFPDDEGSLARIKQTLEENPAVESVDYNYVREPAFTPDDPRFGDQYSLWQIRANKAWNMVRGGPEVDIAVVDTGIDSDHPDLQAKIELRKDFTTTPETPIAEDNDGHGTHVAGIAAAVTDNGTGVAGACPGCDLFVAKVVKNGGATDADVADGIVWATDNGAEVVNLSLGGPDRSDALKNAVDYAWNHGAVVVAAAGNSGRAVKDYPAAYPNAIAVAATNKSDRRASYSSYGKWVDVAAPGSGVFSTYLSGGYKSLGGTSMSAPHVAGLAGLLAAQGRPAPEIRSRIENTATDLGPDGKDKYYGHGRINAYRAVGG